MLRQTGVPSDDLQIVAAVNVRDFKQICFKKGQPRNEHPKTGASGHVFVAVHFSNNQWRLINTIDGTNYESVPWYSPQDTLARMAAEPLIVPPAAYRRFPPELRRLPMIVFQTWPSEKVPLHTFDQRLDLIASGMIATANGETPATAKIVDMGWRR